MLKMEKKNRRINSINIYDSFIFLILLMQIHALTTPIGYAYQSAYNQTINQNINLQIPKNADASYPRCRTSTAILYDPLSELVYMFGGDDGMALGDMWAYNLTANSWDIIDQTITIGTVEGHSYTYDSKRNIIVSFGGKISGTVSNEIWFYNISSDTWTNPSPPVTPRPSPNYKGGMCYDSVLDGYIIAGGGASNCGSLSEESYIYYPGNNSWQNTGSNIDARCNLRVVYDQNANTPIYLGGSNPVSTYPDLNLAYYNHTTKTWEEIDSIGEVPNPQDYHITYDSSKKKVIIFMTKTQDFSENFYSLDTITKTWTNMNALNYPNIVQESSGIVYHAAADKLLYFGDLTIDGSEKVAVWSFDYGSKNWTAMNPLGSTNPQSEDTTSSSTNSAGTDQTSTNSAGGDSSFSIPDEFLYIIPLNFVVFTVIGVYIKKKIKKAKQNVAQIIHDPKAITPEIEHQLLEKFKAILNMSQKVDVSTVAENLEVSQKVLFTQLFKWNKVIPFKIDGEKIIVEDLNNFITALDNQFDEWQERDLTKEGKVE
jgi:galactose oxidase-like protein